MIITFEWTEESTSEPREYIYMVSTEIAILLKV